MISIYIYIYICLFFLNLSLSLSLYIYIYIYISYIFIYRRKMVVFDSLFGLWFMAPGLRPLHSRFQLEDYGFRNSQLLCRMFESGYGRR